MDAILDTQKTSVGNYKRKAHMQKSLTTLRTPPFLYLRKISDI